MKIKQHNDPLTDGYVGKCFGIFRIDNQRAFDIRHGPVTGNISRIRSRRALRSTCIAKLWEINDCSMQELRLFCGNSLRSGFLTASGM